MRRKPTWARRPTNSKPRRNDLSPLRRLREQLRHLPADEALADVDEEAACILVRLREGTPVPAADHSWARDWLRKPENARRSEVAA